MARKSSETKSPLKDPPLRLAGQSLDEEISRLIDEDAMPYVYSVALVTPLALLEWARWYWTFPPAPILYTVFALIAMAACYWKFRVMRSRLHNLRTGRDGERFVGQFLETLREDGFRVFHDLQGQESNVDHVLVGPAGIFTVETKTFSKPARGNAKVTFDGEHILVNGFRPDRDPVTQARAQANWLRNLVLESTGRKVAVRSIVLFPGWWVDPTPASLKPDVWVLEPKALPAFLAHERETLKPEDVKLMSYHISRYVRKQSKAAF